LGGGEEGRRAEEEAPSSSTIAVEKTSDGERERERLEDMVAARKEKMKK
jgi:hypothetical protein